jgi:hypothetical protein
MVESFRVSKAVRSRSEKAAGRTGEGMQRREYHMDEW